MKRSRTVWLVLAALLSLACALGLGFGVRSRKPSHAVDPMAIRDAAWSSYGGSWSVHTDSVENASEERGVKQVLRSQDVADFQIEAGIKMTAADGEAGLLLRSSGEETGVDAYHGYFAGVRIADATLEFGRADFGWHPLQRISLPEGMELATGFYLRAVAVGCDFGVELRARNGVRQTLRAHDPRCLPSGHPGLRSTLSSTTWSQLRVRSATTADLASVEEPQGDRRVVPVDEPYDPARSAAYEASFREEARERAQRAGVQPILNFLMQPGRHPNVTLQGVVISLPPLVAIQDDANALIVPHFHSDVPLKLGDMIIAHGTVVSDRFRSALEDAELHVLWSDLPPPPLAVTAAQLTGGTYRGRRISLEGTLVSAARLPHGQEIILSDGDLMFRGVGSPAYAIDIPHLEIGSRLRVCGMATSLGEFTSGTYPFALLVQQIDLVSTPPWWSPRHVALLGLGGIMLMFAVQYVLHRAQRWRLGSIMKERESLAFEMHDTLAQSFTGIAFQLKAASLERRGEEQIRAHVRHALEMTNLSHKEASRTIAALRPQLRDANAIVKALEQAAHRLVDGGAVVVETSISGRMFPLSVQATDAMFRVGQEAISNAVQHSGCTRLRIALVLQRRKARLTVQDDGCGFDVGAVHAGLGLSGMRSRAEKARGYLEIFSSGSTAEIVGATVRPKGTRISVIVPLPRTAWLMLPLTTWLRSSPSRHPLVLITEERKPGRYEQHG